MRQQNKTDLCLPCKRLSVLITILPQEYIHLVQFSTFLEFIVLTQRVTRTHDYLLKLQDTDDNAHNFLELSIMYFQKSNPQLLFLGLFFFTKTPRAASFHHCTMYRQNTVLPHRKIFFLLVHKAGFVPWWKMHW